MFHALQVVTIVLLVLTRAQQGHVLFARLTVQLVLQMDARSASKDSTKMEDLVCLVILVVQSVLTGRFVRFVHLDMSLKSLK